MIFRNSKKDPKSKRLASDLFKLEEFCADSDYIDFHIPKGIDQKYPDEYVITYKVDSIVSINEDQSPNIKSGFKVRIQIPDGYPMMRAPICYCEDEIWHPNVNGEGRFKGRVCINEHVIGAWQSIELLVVHVGKILQYQNYHALDIQPYPENPKVAKWIREYAEPNDIVNQSKGIAIDDKILQKPSKEWLETRKRKKPKISINSVVVGGKKHDVNTAEPRKNSLKIQIK